MLDFDTFLKGICAGTGYPVVDLNNQKVTLKEFKTIIDLAFGQGSYSVLKAKRCDLLPAHIELLKGKGFKILDLRKNSKLQGDAAINIMNLAEQEGWLIYGLKSEKTPKLRGLDILNDQGEDIVVSTNPPVLDLSNQSVTVDQFALIVNIAFEIGFFSVLKARNCGLTPAHIAQLKGKGFKELDLSHNPELGSDGGKKISELEGLECCDLSHSKVGGQLQGFKSGILSRIVIAGENDGVTKEDVSALMANPHLRQVHFSGACFNQEMYQIITSNHYLTHINLSGCPVSGDALAPLKKNMALRALNLSNCRDLTKNDMKLIGQIGTLTHLTLCGLNLSAASAVGNNKNLQFLDLTFNNKLGDQGFDQIFKSCKKLRFISVYDCSLTDHSMGLIKLMTDLIFIELGENPNISEDKIQELKERIENNDLKNRPTKSGLGFWGTSDSTVAKQSDGQCIFEL